MEEVPKWWKFCRGDESTMVLYRNIGLQVPSAKIVLYWYGQGLQIQFLLLCTSLHNVCWELGRKHIEVQHISDGIILLKLIFGKTVFTFLSVYAPQVGWPEPLKEHFYDQLQYDVARVPAPEILTPARLHTHSQEFQRFSQQWESSLMRNVSNSTAW